MVTDCAAGTSLSSHFKAEQQAFGLSCALSWLPKSTVWRFHCCWRGQTTLARFQSTLRLTTAARARRISEPCQADNQASTSGRHCLACGEELELISFPSKDSLSSNPPLLFLHGALHAAWCYAENFLPYFAERGFDAYALSMRGHGKSDFTPGRTASFGEHIEDLASVIQSFDRPPLLIAHSLGGIFAQRYLAQLTQERDKSGGLPPLAGVGFIASPALPAMLSPSIDWFRQLQGIKHGLQVIWWMSAMPKRNQGLVQTLFFSPDLPVEKFKRYHQNMMRQRSILPVTGRELVDYKRNLDDARVELRQQDLPVLVMMAGKDRLLMPCQVDALAEMLGTESVVIADVGHDLMLDTRWKDAADVLDTWARTLATFEA